MKSVILFIDSLTQGGAQRQLVGLAVLLKSKGYNVQIVTYHDVPFFLRYLEDQGVKYLCIQNHNNILSLLRLVKQIFHKLHPDIVISYLDSPNIIACLIRLCGEKFRLIVSERNTTQKQTVKGIIKFFLYKWADVIVANSYSQEKYILGYYPKYNHKLKVITNFVDLEVFRPVKKKRDSDAIKIIGVGRIETQKNIGCLIRATKLVIDQGYDVHVDWYGRKTSLIKDYEKMLDLLNLDFAFTFHEPTTDIHERYQQSDLFCLPSLYEGYPNVLCEAMACGLPVICSDICDNPLIIQENVNGLLFNPHDYRELAEQIIRFITTSDEEKKLMGEKSRELAKQKFGKEPFVEKYIKLISQL